MVGLNNIFLNFLQVVAYDVHVRVLLAVNGALLKSHEQLVELHRNCGCADCVPVCDVVLVGHNTNLLASQICYGFGRNVGGQLTETSIRESKHMNAGCLAVLIDLFLSVVAFQEVSHMVDIIEYVRHIEQSHLFYEVGQVSGHTGNHLDRTGYACLILLGGVCQLAARIQLDVDAAVGFLFYQVCEVLNHLVVGGGLGYGHSQVPAVITVVLGIACCCCGVTTLSLGVLCCSCRGGICSVGRAGTSGGTCYQAHCHGSCE